MLVAYLFGRMPRLEKWIASSERNFRIAIVGWSVLLGFFGSGYIVVSAYFLFRLILPAGWLP